MTTSSLLYVLAGMIPKPIREWVIIRAFAEATTGEWSHVEAPALTVFDMMERIR